MPSPAKNALHPAQHSPKEASPKRSFNGSNCQTHYFTSVQYKPNEQLFAAHLYGKNKV
jgi:hypothetical protein